MSELLYPIGPRDVFTDLAGHTRQINRLKNRSCGPKIYPGDVGSISPWLNGWGDIGGSWMRSHYFVLLGGGKKVVVNAVGGTPGDPLWQFPAGYFDPDGDEPLNAYDGVTGAFTAMVVTSAGFLVHFT